MLTVWTKGKVYSAAVFQFASIFRGFRNALDVAALRADRGRYASARYQSCNAVDCFNSTL